MIFLCRTQQDGIIPELHQDGQGGVDSLALSIRQQLERGGLLQQLPAVITAAAQQLADLQDRPAVLAAGLTAPCYSTSPVSQEPSQLYRIQSNVVNLFAVLQVIQPLWPLEELNSRVLPPLSLFLMQLTVQVMQHVSICV
jgi:hypothetical protein